MNQGESKKVAHKSIAPGAGVGPVHLGVRDPVRATAFYENVAGLLMLDEQDDSIRIGIAGKELVVLHPDAAEPVPQGRTGLYHLAIVVPSLRELARVVRRLEEMHYPQSPTDHLMTKSDYFWDPDGNGIEIYAETPEDGTWFMSEDQFAARDASGILRSGRDPIDMDKLYSELEANDPLDTPLPEGTKMGHVHLHIRDVDEALRFYRDLIGFDVTGVSRTFGAAFVSAGGYHHHLGLNTWAGRGAPPPPPNFAGLRHFTIELPSARDLAETTERLRAGSQEVVEGPDGEFITHDPSANRCHLRVRAS